jgi:hypothetical protein
MTPKPIIFPRPLPLFSLCLLICLEAVACSKAGTPSSPPGGTDKPTTWYVSATGGGAGTGSLSAPFTSINTALNSALPGDTVMLRGGVYYEAISFPRSGSLGKNITLKAYSGERPSIDGSRITASGAQAMLTLRDNRYITLDGLDICNLSGGAGADPEGVSINGASHDITVSHCTIYNIKSTATLAAGRSGHAILVLGTNNSTPISNLVITGNTVHDTQTGTSENITLAGNVDSFTVSSNTLYNTENIGIIIAGGDNLNPSGNAAVNYARNGVVTDNTLYNISMTNSVATWGVGNYGAIAIYICGGAGTIVERNTVYNCDRGIGLVSESNIYPTATSIVRNNFVYGCWRTGIYMGDYLNFTGSGTRDCYVVNNTLFQNDRALGAYGEIEGELRLTEHCDSNVVENNLVYASAADVFVHKYTTTGTGNSINNNLYYTTGTPGWIWQSTNGAPAVTLGAWQAASGMDAGSIYGTDPRLVSASLPDLHIQSSSPARNAGAVISPAVNGSTDIDGNPRIVNGKISIGAQQ